MLDTKVEWSARGVQQPGSGFIAYRGRINIQFVWLYKDDMGGCQNYGPLSGYPKY